MRLALAIFIVVHAMVHLMYVGHAARWFELKTGMAWPDGARFVPSGMSDQSVRTFAVAAITTTGLAMIVGAVAMMAKAGWGDWVVIGAATLVSIAHALLWSGKWSDFSEHGGIGVVINVAVIAAIVALR